MDRPAQLDTLISQFDLNEHPFYKDWSAGILPKESLRTYSGEYAPFIGTIALGWETVGQTHYADEEREHEVLWSRFRAELGGSASSSNLATETLRTAATNLFKTGKPEALGALYAFEAQQPHTSRAKLDGLNKYYGMSKAAKEYFEVHADDVQEAAWIREQLAGLSPSEFARAKNACAIVCTAMIGALDEIYYSRELATA